VGVEFEEAGEEGRERAIRESAPIEVREEESRERRIDMLTFQVVQGW